MDDEKMNICGSIEKAIEKDREQSIAYEQKLIEYESKDKKDKIEADKFLRYCSKASVRDYAEWLQAYLEQGGQITHVYEYCMPDCFLIAEDDIHIAPLYGASSVSIIAKDVLVSFDKLGHNDLFVLINGVAECHGIVPLYRDVKDYLTRKK